LIFFFSRFSFFLFPTPVSGYSPVPAAAKAAALFFPAFSFFPFLRSVNFPLRVLKSTFSNGAFYASAPFSDNRFRGLPSPLGGKRPFSFKIFPQHPLDFRCKP
jgi:hypothetical protein